MTATPWGDSQELRARKLAPGSRATREVVVRSQRERLFAAMVARVAERGYEATSVADVLALSGVSRSAFYVQFSDKRKCFLAMLDEVLAGTMAAVAHRCEGLRGRERGQAALETFVGLVAFQPTTARACLVEAYAAGPEAVSRIDRTIAEFETMIASIFAGMDRERGMPGELAKGIAGALYKVIHTRVYCDQVDELADLAPKLLAWVRSYEPPPQPLLRGHKLRSSSPSPPPFVAHDPAERIMRALAATVAERGYPKAGIAEIVRRASMSQSTFYKHFDSKEEATIAALDSSGAQMLAATLPAVRRASDWPSAVRSAYASMCGFMAAEPDFARLRAVEVYAAGPRALEMRDRAGAELLEALVAADPQGPAAEAEPIVLEAIAGAVYALVYDCVRDSGPEALPTVVPPATYIALAPFIGAERACEVANEDGRRR